LLSVSSISFAFHLEKLFETLFVRIGMLATNIHFPWFAACADLEFILSQRFSLAWASVGVFVFLFFFCCFFFLVLVFVFVFVFVFVAIVVDVKGDEMGWADQRRGVDRENFLQIRSTGGAHKGGRGSA
jgi:uncharacterized membrane protein